MLGVRAALLAFFLMIAWSAIAHSQPAPKAPEIKANQKADGPAKGKEAGEQDERNAGNPLAAHPAPQSSYAETDRGGERDKTADYWTVLGYKGRITDWLLALFTLCLVIATIILGGIGVWQGIQLRQAVNNDIRGQRPYVVPGTLAFRLAFPTVQNATETTNPFNVSYHLYNVGKSHAVIEEYRHAFYFGDAVPAEPSYPTSSIINEVRTPVTDGDAYPPDDGNPIRCTYHRGFTQAEMEAIRAGTKHLLFFGRVQYTDNFGFTHEKSFGFVFVNQVLAVYPRAAYNYEKSYKTQSPSWRRWSRRAKK